MKTLKTIGWFILFKLQEIFTFIGKAVFVIIIGAGILGFVGYILHFLGYGVANIFYDDLPFTWNLFKEIQTVDDSCPYCVFSLVGFLMLGIPGLVIYGIGCFIKWCIREIPCWVRSNWYKAKEKVKKPTHVQRVIRN